MLLSPKQVEFVKSAHHRWNFKGGATRSGKTYLDFKWIIPMRIRERIGKDGLAVILGVTKSTIERNVLEPMRNIYGDLLVGTISSDNTAWLFGEKCYCLGAEKVSQVSKIRGASIKYCYGDEVADWSVDVFELLKSRLDKEYSCFDGTFNPQGPRHWLKGFLDSEADIFSQTYTIDDNPFLPELVKENLKREYYGTVFYDRYILGLWKAADGAIYRVLADNPSNFLIYERPSISFATIGVDFGGNGSATTFNLTGFTRGFKEIITLNEYYKKKIMSPSDLEKDFVEFVKECKDLVPVWDAYCDSAEQTLIQGLRSACAQYKVGINIHNAKKGPINDRIRFFCRLQATGRHKIMTNCTHTLEAFQSAVWDSKHITEDVRLDDGSINIDSLDAQEYAVEPYMRQMLNIW